MQYRKKICFNKSVEFRVNTNDLSLFKYLFNIN